MSQTKLSFNNGVSTLFYHQAVLNAVCEETGYIFKIIFRSVVKKKRKSVFVDGELDLWQTCGTSCSAVATTEGSVARISNNYFYRNGLFLFLRRCNGIPIKRTISRDELMVCT
jgi:hypothetical protein